MRRILSAAVLALLPAACAGGSADAKPPKPNLVTTSEMWDGPNRDFIWHGTIDGRECIIVEGRAPSVTCNWGAR